PPDGSYTNARSLTVTGTVVDRSPVQVDVLGVSATVSGQSFVAVGIPVGDDGPMAVRATATDAAGNSAAHQVGLVVDRVPPVMHISRPTPGEASRGGALHVEGTFQDDSPVSMVYVNGQPATLQPSGPGGTFSATVTVTDGPILVEAAAHDAAGNVGTDRVSAIVDSTPPLLTIASPAGGTVTNAAAIHVSGAVHDETRVTLTLGNMPVAAAPDGSFEVEAPLGSTDGDQQLTLTAVDAAGNASAASVGVVVDRTAPQLEVVAPVAGAVLGALPVLVQGVVQDASAVSVAVDGVLATVTGSAWSVSLDSLAEGSHLFEVRATDAAGNASSASVQTQIDLSPPAVHIGSPASGSVTREAGVAVTGTVTPPSATVQVNGAAAVVSGTSFSVVVPLLEGDNSIHAVAQRPGSQRSSEDTILVTRDSTPPVVLLSAPEVVARERAGRVSVTATDNIAVASVEIRLDGTSVASFTAPPYEADLSVPATAHDGDTLTVTAIAVDRAGNTVTAERGMRVAAAGVIVGQVLAASTGLPMRAVAVRMLSGTSGAQTETDEHGRFTLPADGVRVAVRAERDGYTSVDRQASMVSEVGNVLVDARLTQLAGPVSIGPDGGTLAATGDGVEVVVPPGTVAAPADFALTPLSAQGLPGLLPLGWSPLVALDLRTAAPTLGPLTLRIANWAAGPVQLAAYRTSTLGWFVVARDLDAADGTLTASLPAPGAYALVAADQGEPVVVVPDAGQDLAGVDAADLPQDASSLAAATPATLPAAGGTAEGRLALVTATSLPSGTVVQAAVTETYTLGSGDVASEEKRLEDIVLFRAGAPADAALAATFPVTASRTFGPTDLVEGHVHLDILAGREGVRGKAAGNDAVTLSSGNLALSVAGGSLEKNTAVTLEASELSSFLPQTASLTPLAEAVVDVSGAQLTIAAELSMDAGSLPTGGTLLVARVVRVEGVPRLQVVSLAARVGDRVVTQPYPGLPGVREDGRYVFLRSAVPVGFVSGTVDGNGPVAALVMSNGMPLVFLSGADGRYILPTLTGSVSVSARALDGSGSATGPALVTELQTTVLDLPLTGGGAVVSVSPPDGATGVATTAQVEITSDVPLDPATVTTGTLQLLKDGATVTVRVVLSASGKRVALVPESALSRS
ncbi:MAG TPA: Ig-like domain-containing protein, partial [Kineosporiaceae bacterium]|nr:Ig-like domain-containing protein [Kineosporiaceae bacterium]